MFNYFTPDFRHKLSGIVHVHFLLNLKHTYTHLFKDQKKKKNEEEEIKGGDLDKAPSLYLSLSLP
jgi:hypothetical protein